MSTASDKEWEEYKQKFNKSYKDAEEDEMRRRLYNKTKVKVDDHNKKFEAGEVSFSMGINHLSDLTEEEYTILRGKKSYV